MVTIQNLTNEMQTFALEHDAYCVPVGKCGCYVTKHSVLEMDRKSGKILPRELVTKSAASLYVPASPYHIVEHLPDCIAEIPAIKRALDPVKPRIRLTVERSKE